MSILTVRNTSFPFRIEILSRDWPLNTKHCPPLPFLNAFVAECPSRVPYNADDPKVPKKVQRSRYKTVRPYSWKQPFKNKAGLRSKGLQPPKRTNKKASSNTEPDLSKHGETTPSLKRKRTVLSDEDEFDVDDLFEETDEGEVMVDVDTEGESEGEADAVESDEDSLFVAKKETRAASRATTRQLAMMVRKNMKELYKLADINLSKPESLCVDQNTLRQVVDKVKNGEAADLSSGKLVHFGRFLINPEIKSMRSTQEPKRVHCSEFSAVKANQKLSLPLS